MANLLSKLRIEYSSLTMLQGITDQPKDETIQLHNKSLDGFMEGQNSESFISNHEYKQLQEKTYRQLRLRELLIQHSAQASLIVMSLPMPRQVKCQCRFFNEFFNLSHFPGNCLGSALHVMARHVNDGHATVTSRAWKSIISSDFLLLNIHFIS